MRFFAFERKKPVEWMIPSSSDGSAAARSAGVGYFANSVGVTMLTRSSVHCADRIVAQSNSNALVWLSAQCASGYSSASPSTTTPARARAPRGRATGEGYPRPVTTEALTRVDPAEFAQRRDAITALDARVRAAEGHEALGDAVWRDLEHPGADSAGFLLDDRGYVHVARGDR